MKRSLKKLYWAVIRIIPGLNLMYYTRDTQVPIKFRHFIWKYVFGTNRRAYFPTHFTSTVSHPKNIYCGIETSPGYSPGCYIQGIGKIYIDDYTQIGPNVGIISANHELTDNRKHIVKEVRIGKYCWIGMGALIMPGVELGDYTVVAAGSVVTKSFQEGYCLIGGNPAKVIKAINKEDCVYHKSEYEYNGFVHNSKFENYRAKNLMV